MKGAAGPKAGAARSRAARVAEGVREELATLIARRVRDPRAAGTVVTRVEVPDDLQSARVYVRTLGGDPVRGAAAAQALSRAGGMLRAEVGRALGLRYAPELTFVYDSGQDAATRIEEVLREIEAERRK